jgi:hypothetical protein
MALDFAQGVSLPARISPLAIVIVDHAGFTPVYLHRHASSALDKISPVTKNS